MSPLTIKEIETINSLVRLNKFPTTLFSNLSPSYNNGGYACNEKDNYRKRKVEEEAGQQHKKIKNYSINSRTSRKEIWKENLQKVKTYINENNKLPSTVSKNEEIKGLGLWLKNQKHIYKNKERIMKIDEIRKEWEIFIKEYEEYFKSYFKSYLQLWI